MKFIKENFDNSVDRERRVVDYKQKRYLEALNNNKKDPIYLIEYYTNRKKPSYLMVRATDSDMAEARVRGKYREQYNENLNITAIQKISYREAKEKKKKGMFLGESLTTKNTFVQELAKKHNVVVEDYKDDIKVTGTKKDIQAFSNDYYNADADFKFDVDEDTTTTEDEIPASPETPDDMGIANLLNLLIQDEWQAINGYNDTILTLRAMADDSAENKETYEKLVKILEDISAEENNHVGMLQSALGVVSPNVSEIKGGEKEAAETLDSDEESAS